METIGTIEISKSTELNFYVEGYKDVLYGNIRKFITTEKYTGPTKKGIMLSHENLKEIIKKINDNIESFKKFEEVKQEVKLDDERYINIAIVTFKEKKYFELREYLNTEKYSGPTKKGVTIPVAHFEETLVFLTKMDAFLEKK
ncbi:hypothetical protein KAU33_14325 [Candidatus Dependentiae bacterium]|nr:hypothetical protein [Candidatus Dependentiae bacterium]